jgi:hypothetical protein
MLIGEMDHQSNGSSTPPALQPLVKHTCGEDIDTCTVEVLPVPEIMIDILSEIVEAIDLPKGTENSLGKSLDTAMKILEDRGTTG